jgi:hypothetical protein
MGAVYNERLRRNSMCRKASEPFWSDRHFDHNTAGVDSQDYNLLAPPHKFSVPKGNGSELDTKRPIEHSPVV